MAHPAAAGEPQVVSRSPDERTVLDAALSLKSVR
jgi:hypothetical protein